MAQGRRPIRVGLAGIGALYWPVTIAEGIAARRDAKLVSFATLGVGDQEIEHHLGMSPEAYARRYGAAQHRGVEQMMEAEDLDVVAVCARHTEHAKLVELLGPYGKDVFVAKTFATTMAAADRIVEAERKSRIRVAVGPSARFLPWFSAAKKVVDAGRIGTPFSLRICHHHGTIDVFHPRDFYRDPAEGGPELSLGWYLIDLVMHFLGPQIERVWADYGTYTTPVSPFMDRGTISVRMARGAMATCDMYFCNRFGFPGWEMEIVGDKGALLLRQSGALPWGTSLTLTTPAGQKAVPVALKGPHWELFWIDDFRRDGPPSVGAAYAREVTRICLAARRSARSGRPVAC